ncbi:MAG: efflux RND transporter periplasmic adaptor subunit [Pseudomonadota bacterium]
MSIFKGVMLGCVSGAALAVSVNAQEEPAEVADVIRPVVVEEVAEGSGAFTRQFFGVVVARETVDLAFQVSGQIIENNAIEGETIPMGEVVAELDLEPFEIALNRAVVSAEQADREFVRLQRLQGSAVSQVTVDDAETAADLAELNVNSAALDLEYATLRAPFDALVATRNAANFTTISAGTPVARLHDMSDLRVEIDVPEVLFQQAGSNPDVNITAVFPAAPDRVFRLEPREFNAETSAIGQTFQITLGMAPPEGLTIFPGSSATITATIGSNDPQIVVPPMAIATSSEGTPSVLVFEENGDGTGTLSRRGIELGADGDGHPVVLSGLSVGESIVVAGVNDLTDGQTVRRFDGFPD